MLDLGNLAWKHLKALCEKIGPRPVGSASMQAAAAYIYDAFSAAGLQVSEQTVDMPLWRAEAVSLRLGEHSLPVFANTFSPSCDIKAPTVLLSTRAALAAAELDGQIAVLYGELSQGTGVGSRRAYYYPDADRELIDLLEMKNPAAVVWVVPRPNSTERMLQDWEFPIASVSVPAEAGLALLAAGDQLLHLQVQIQREPGFFANLLAEKPGSAPDRLLLMAHYDTMPDSPGASDNGSGVAVLLSVAAALAEHKLPLSVEFLALCGEEAGGLGDVVYLDQRRMQLDSTLAAINLDGLGQALAANTITTLGGSPTFQQTVQEVHAQFPGVVWVDPWYESDHTAFAMQGVPAVAISSLGVNAIHHTPHDTLQWVQPGRLAEAASLVLALVNALQELTTLACRKTLAEGQVHNDTD